MVTFREIKLTRKISGKCSKCSKRRTITISEYQTINQWNINKDGFPKTEREIVAEINQYLLVLEDGLKRNFICRTCNGLYKKR